MSPQPRLIRFMSRVSLLGLLATLGVVTWSTPGQARGFPEVIGLASNGAEDPPPRGFEPYCTFSWTISCPCPPPTVATFTHATGCSTKSVEEAKNNAPFACSNLCDRARKDSGIGGGVAGRPGGSTGGGVTLDGAGTMAPLESEGYVGFVPFSVEPIGHTWEKEQLAEELVQRTSVPWVRLLGLGESIQWEDPKGSAAFVQGYWSERGAPSPIGQCHHALQVSCPLEDVRLGDSLQVCSGESDQDAQKIAETSCAPLRYDALSRAWKTWGIFGIQEENEGPYRAPSATVRAVGPLKFLGYVPSSLEAVGPYEDWSKLADKLLERTQGTAVWLSGPAKYYAPK